MAVSVSIETVNLGEAPGGMNLIAVRQADELRAPGCPAGMKQRAHGVAIGSRTENRGCHAARASAASNRSCSGRDHLRRRSPARSEATARARSPRWLSARSAGSSASDGITSTVGVFRDQQIGYRVGGEQIIDRAGRAGDLSPNQGDRYLRQRRAEEGDGAAAGADAERAEQIGGTRHAREAVPGATSEPRLLRGRRSSSRSELAGPDGGARSPRTLGTGYGRARPRRRAQRSNATISAIVLTGLVYLVVFGGRVIVVIGPRLAAKVSGSPHT